jgi:hypothetical protein
MCWIIYSYGQNPWCLVAIYDACSAQRFGGGQLKVWPKPKSKSRDLSFFHAVKVA